MTITHANTLTLNALTARVGQGAPDPARELRSTGTNLYVKSGAGIITKPQSRLAHQQNAMAIVRASLTNQFGIQDAQAGQIMTNVFGRQAQITVGDLRRLDGIATTATALRQAGHATVDQSLELAQRVDADVNAQRATPQAAAAQGNTAAEIIGPHADAALAWTLAAQVPALEASGLSHADAVTQARTAAELMTAGLAQPLAFSLAAEAQRLEAQGVGHADAVGRVRIANELTTGGVRQAQSLLLAEQVQALELQGVSHEKAIDRAHKAANLIHDGKPLALAFELAARTQQLEGPQVTDMQAWYVTHIAVDLMDRGMNIDQAYSTAALVDRKIDTDTDRGTALRRAVEGWRIATELASGVKSPDDLKGVHQRGLSDYVAHGVRLQADALPLYVRGSPATAQWTRLAQGCGAHLPPDLLTSLPLSQRASMLTALSEHCAIEISAGREAAAAKPYEALGKLGQAFPIGDLIPPSETPKQQNFYDAVRQSPTLVHARQHWATMDQPQRSAAMAEIARLHSAQFTYQRPRVELGQPDMRELGSYSSVTDTLTINATARLHRTFAGTFNTMVHELTHRYQAQMAEDLQTGRLTAADDRYQQARVMAANASMPVTEDLSIRFVALADGYQTPLSAVARMMVGIKAEAAYRSAPNETHAFHIGDSAEREVT